MEPGEVDGGPGWVIGADLRPRIVDLERFRAAMRDDPLAGVIEALWTGDTRAASRLLASFPDGPRTRALRADSLAAQGAFSEALRVYDVLVEEAVGTTREAVMRQHRGKVLLAAGETDAAIADFSRALELRRDADATLRASSEQALRVGRRLRDGGRDPS